MCVHISTWPGNIPLVHCVLYWILYWTRSRNNTVQSILLVLVLHLVTTNNTVQSILLVLVLHLVTTGPAVFTDSEDIGLRTTDHSIQKYKRTIPTKSCI